MTASIHLLLPKTAQGSQEGDQDASPDLPPNPFKHQTCKETIRTLLYDVDGLSNPYPFGRPRSTRGCRRAGAVVESDNDRLLLPASFAVEDKLVLAGLVGLDKREPHSGFTSRTGSIQ